MKTRSVIEVETSNIAEEQFLLNKFPGAIWIALGERTKFYIPYAEYHVVQEMVDEWEKQNGREKV
jgi:hypothetical protein